MMRRNFGRQQTTVASPGGGWQAVIGSNTLRVGLILFPVVGADLLADFDGDTPVGQGVIIPNGGKALVLDYGTMGESIKGPIRLDTSVAGVINLLEIVNFDAN